MSQARDKTITEDSPLLDARDTDDAGNPVGRNHFASAHSTQSPTSALNYTNPTPAQAPLPHAVQIDLAGLEQNQSKSRDSFFTRFFSLSPLTTTSFLSWKYNRLSTQDIQLFFPSPRQKTKTPLINSTQSEFGAQSLLEIQTLKTLPLDLFLLILKQVSFSHSNKIQSITIPNAHSILLNDEPIHINDPTSIEDALKALIRLRGVDRYFRNQIDELFKDNPKAHIKTFIQKRNFANQMFLNRSQYYQNEIDSHFEEYSPDKIQQRLSNNGCPIGDRKTWIFSGISFVLLCLGILLLTLEGAKNKNLTRAGFIVFSLSILGCIINLIRAICLPQIETEDSLKEQAQNELQKLITNQNQLEPNYLIREAELKAPVYSALKKHGFFYDDHSTDDVVPNQSLQKTCVIL